MIFLWVQLENLQWDWRGSQCPRCCHYSVCDLTRHVQSLLLRVHCLVRISHQCRGPIPSLNRRASHTPCLFPETVRLRFPIHNPSLGETISSRELQQRHAPPSHSFRPPRPIRFRNHREKISVLSSKELKPRLVLAVPPNRFSHRHLSPLPCLNRPGMTSFVPKEPEPEPARAISCCRQNPIHCWSRRRQTISLLTPGQETL
mmetsp:Transcript_10856/g.20709  ORF Transcript_10856/g.20709 Transcript_10856/m.20709 type:complete len:202 (+) Transcript_10856:506-1111(+)